MICYIQKALGSKILFTNILDLNSKSFIYNFTFKLNSQFTSK